MKRMAVIFVSLLFAITLAFCSFTCFAADVPEVALDGVQIRLSEPWGLRFIARVSGVPSDYDEVGVMVIPKSLLSGELTTENETAKKISSLDDEFKYFEISDTSFSYTACIIDIEYAIYDRDYVVRPYVRYTPEGGEQQTIYGENSDEYTLSAAEFTELALEHYADIYTEDKKADHDAIDDMVTGYNRYLDSIAVPDEDVTEELLPVELIELNEWYWRLGTITSTTGLDNETNLKRIYTKNYIPAKDTIITADGASGVQYIVMEYDADKKFLSTMNWSSTAGTYTQKNSNAAYYRCILTYSPNVVLTEDDIAELSSHLSIKVPIVTANKSLGVDSWTVGGLYSGTGQSSTRTDRIYTPAYIPANAEITYDGASGTKVLVMEYADNTETTGSINTLLSTTNFKTSAFTYEKVNSDANYYRLSMGYTDNRTVTADAVSDLAQHVSVKLPVEAKHSFLSVGTLGSSGERTESDAYAYSHYYIPVGSGFTFDASSGYKYTVYYYDSNRAFISNTDALTSSEFPSVPENAVYYRFVVDPSGTVTSDDVDIIGSAFNFSGVRTAPASDWEKGTIAGATGEANTSAANRIYTPRYYNAENIDIKWTVDNSYASAYVVLAYAADKSYLGTCGDNATAAFGKASMYPTAKYYRFALKTLVGVTDSNIADIASVISITEKNSLFEIETIVPEVELEKFGDEGLAFRFAYESIGSLSSGNYLSGLCVVEDELWLFSTADKGSDGYGVTLRYSLDFQNKTAEYLGYFRHNFGHANSVDYSSENKCLTFGNGSGSFYNDTNYFYAYENAYEEVKAGAESLELENAICYDWADCGIAKMTKLNTCWYGDSSLFVGANNNGYVYKIALGTGSRVLKYGTASEVEEGKFNGTWDILKSYEMSDNYDNAQAAGFRGQSYDQCNQGTCFADGTLYLNCGHDGVYFWRCRLDSDGSIKRDEFHKYMTVGTSTITGGISGIDDFGDYLIFMNGAYVNIYENSSLY